MPEICIEIQPRDDGAMADPWKNHFLLAGQTHWNSDDAPDPKKMRPLVEPWLTAVFQSDHLSSLIGSGIGIALASACSVKPANMDPAKFTATHADEVAKGAARLANR